MNNLLKDFLLFVTDKYRAINKLQNWDESRAACKKYGGDLARVSDDLEYSLIYLFPANSGAPYYIGLTDTEEEGHFIWTNGMEMSYKAWRAGEPNNHDQREDCVIQFLDGWNDVPCSFQFFSICENF